MDNINYDHIITNNSFNELYKDITKIIVNIKPVIFCHIPMININSDIFNNINYESYGHSYIKNRPDSSFVFSIVKNPFSLLVELFLHDNNNGYANWNNRYNLKSFNDFVTFICKDNPLSNNRDSLFGQIYDAKTDNLYVDIVYKQEHKQEMYENLSILLSKINNNINNNDIYNNVIIINDTKIPKNIIYKNYYTKDLIDLVQTTFQKDLEFFGYDFEGSTNYSIIYNEYKIKKK